MGGLSAPITYVCVCKWLYLGLVSVYIRIKWEEKRWGIYEYL